MAMTTNLTTPVRAGRDKSDKSKKCRRPMKLRRKQVRRRRSVASTADVADVAKADENKGTLWVEVPESGKLRGVDVQIGVSDGTSTEITGGDIKEGDEVVDRRAASRGGDG